MTTFSRAKTVLDALVDAIDSASAHNRQDQVAPDAVLWTDEERQWEALLPRLKERLPLFVLGKYSPDQHIGPAYWLRCIIARTIPHPRSPAGEGPSTLPTRLLSAGSESFGDMPRRVAAVG